jgi:hypothetical protein
MSFSLCTYLVFLATCKSGILLQIGMAGLKIWATTSKVSFLIGNADWQNKL